MKHVFSKLFFLSLTICMVACSGVGGHKAAENGSLEIRLFSASGLSVLPHSPVMTRAQQRLVAEQAAKMNAYRALASSLYREKLTAGRTVGGQVLKDENYRIYFDAFLREAKVSALQTLGNTVHASLTLSVTDRFYRCMEGAETVVQKCLLQDNKMPFTRLGYDTAELKTLNLACGNADCSGMLNVHGFADQKNAFDRGLLNAGLYDGEWLLNTTGRLVINAIFFEGLSQ